MSRKPTDPALRITIAEAALVLGLSKETIKRRISSGGARTTASDEDRGRRSAY